MAFTFTYIIKNNMTNFTAYTESIDKVVPVDDLTVKFYCSKPKANMLTIWVPILPAHVWSKVSPSAAAKSFQNPAPIVGTGPFQVTQVKKGADLHEAEPVFLGSQADAGRDHLQRLSERRHHGAGPQVRQPGRGLGVPSAEFGQLQSDKTVTPIAYNLIHWDYLSFNCYTGPSLGDPALRDVRFRQALNWAIDRQRLVSRRAGRGKPATP